MPPLDTLPIYNVLVLGPSQSGKSTFIEFVKKYADSSYTINENVRGIGNWTCTQDVRSEVVVTNLPIYKLFDLDDSDDDWDVSVDGEREIDIDATLSQSNVKPFKKLLERDENLKVRPETNPDSEWARFQLIDTPGLDDTNGDDIRNLARVFEALSTVDKLHLVLIVDSNKPFSKSVVEAFKTYFHIFEELNSLAVVLHTHVRNINRHPSKTTVARKLQERSEFFNEIAGRKIPTKRIDCDTDESGFADTCLTQNTIQEILEIAKLKTPVSSNITFIRKTPKMATVDAALREKCQKELDSIHASCEALNKIDRLSLKLHNTEQQLESLTLAVKTYDTDDLVTLFEDYLDEEWTYFVGIEDHELHFPPQEFIITKKVLSQRSFNVQFEVGGEGERHWYLRFRRTFFQTGHLRVVLSTTSRIRYRDMINGWKKTIQVLGKTLEDQKEQLSVLERIVQHTTKRNDTLDVTEQLKFKLGLYGVIQDHAKANILPMALFLELAKADMYQDSDVLQSAQALESHFEKMYKENPKGLLQGSWAEHISKPV
ncbi:hypothetical protein BGX31_006343 [Mortierella sp. GBA43]|nr:hypothetical protein BGX31_006343 [Mortierella sp. GBA43]